MSTPTLRGEATHPSKYLKAIDLDYGTRVVTIAGGDWEAVGDDRKVVLRFSNLDKGLVLNKTNADAISLILNESLIEQWVGQQVQLYVTQQAFKGQTYDVIRVQRAPVMEEAVAEAVAEEVPF